MAYSKSILILILAFWWHTAQANVVGTDLQNFNPTTNGLDFATVHSANVLEPGQFNVGTFFTFATNSLPFFKLTNAANNQTFTEPNDLLTANALHFGIGILKGWDIGVALDNVVAQSVDNSQFLGTFRKTGLTDIRANTKFRVYDGKKGAFAFILSADFDQVVNNPFAGDGSGPTINAELAWSKKITEMQRLAVNFGYRLRDQGTPIPNTAVSPIPDQWLYSVAWSHLLDSINSEVLVELYGADPIDRFETPVDRKNHSLQFHGGLKWKPIKDLDVHVGAGRELYHGFASPDILLYGGVNWRYQIELPDPPPYVPPKDSDEDGVFDDSDHCPNTPKGVKVNDLGCEPKKVQDITLKDVNFFTDTTTLTPESRTRFESTVKEIQKNLKGITKIVVEGHTDSRGSDNYNKLLSQRRANRIRELLVELVPFEAKKIEAIGYGELRPIDSNDTPSGRLKNRRVELRVIRDK